MVRVLMLSKACLVGIYQRKLEHIAQAGIDLLTLVPPSWRDERGIQRLERVYTQGYQLETTPIHFNGNFHLHYYPEIGTVIRAFQPHIVHIDEEPYNLATWHALYHARRAGAKTIFFTWQNIARRYPPPFQWGERWVLKHIDAAIMGTQSAVDVWRQKGYTSNAVVIPQFGIDPELFQPLTRAAERPFTIGYIGRLVTEKGLDVLLQAISDLGGDWRLRIVGSGPSRDHLRHWAQRQGIAGRVTFVEWVASTEMPAQYHQLDCLVLPSLTRPNWKEQFGRVLVEAMASKVAVIGSDSGAIPGVVGEGGIVVPEDDPAALRQALQTLQQDKTLRQALGKKGRQRVHHHFTHAHIAQATVSLYRQLV